MFTGSQSYQTLISLFFRFLLLILSVSGIRKYCLCFEMAKLNSKKQKKSSFYEEKSLVGLTQGQAKFFQLNKQPKKRIDSKKWLKLTPKLVIRV